MNRQQANRKLVAILARAVDKYPDMRLMQLLLSCEFVCRTSNPDEPAVEFEPYIEPEDQLRRVQAAIKLHNL